MVVICASGSKGTSIASMSSAPILKESISSFWVLSCAFTPGKSTSQPIHQPPDFLITDLNFIITSQKEYPNPCKSDRANSSRISLCLGTSVFSIPLWNMLWCRPSRARNASWSLRCLMSWFLFIWCRVFIWRQVDAWREIKRILHLCRSAIAAGRQWRRGLRRPGRWGQKTAAAAKVSTTYAGAPAFVI